MTVSSFDTFQRFKFKLRPLPSSLAGNSQSTHWIMRAPDGWLKVIFTARGQARVMWDLRNLPETVETFNHVRVANKLLRVDSEELIDLLVDLVRPIHDILAEARMQAHEDQAVQFTQQLMNKLRGKS